MSRGRKPIEINKVEFQACVSEIEGKNTFSNRTELWEAVEASDWAKTREPRPLTSQVALLKAEELGLEIKTVKGKRGKTKGCGPVSVGGRKKKVFSPVNIRSGIPLDMRASLEKAVQRAANGSLKARIKLMCMDCTNWQKKEIALCENIQCPMHDVRPYKVKVEGRHELPMI